MEAIDRLSRLEAVDGLQDVLLALVRAGVSIVTLEDGAEYSRATLREDGSKLIILAVKAQAAVLVTVVFRAAKLSSICSRMIKSFAGRK